MLFALPVIGTRSIEFHEVFVTAYVLANAAFASGPQLCQSVMPVGVEKISTAQKYVLARRRLVKLINNRAKLLSLCSCILNGNHSGNLNSDL